MPPKPPDNKEVGNTLREVALLLELKGENPFKIRAYSNAARSIEISEEEVSALIHEGRLKEIEGVGEALAQHIAEIILTEFKSPRVKISVAKLSAIRGVKKVGVCIERQRNEP